MSVKVLTKEKEKNVCVCVRESVKHFTDAYRHVFACHIKTFLNHNYITYLNKNVVHTAGQ